MMEAGRKNAIEEDYLDLENWVPFRMYRVAEAVGNILADYYGPELGLKRAEWRALAVAASYPGASAKDIGEIGDMDPFTVSRAITQLTKLGYAVRTRNAPDKRQASLTILPAGKQAVEQVSDLARSMEALLLKDVSEQELRAFKQLIGKMEDATAILRARGWKNIRAPKDDRDDS